MLSIRDPGYTSEGGIVGGGIGWGLISYHPQESQCSRLQSGSMSILDSAVFGGQNFGYLGVSKNGGTPK